MVSLRPHYVISTRSAHNYNKTHAQIKPPFPTALGLGIKMSATKLRVGIIGAGEVAQVCHLPVLALLEHLYSISIICDISEKVSNLRTCLIAKSRD
jgi:hypothetical protein